MYPIQKMAFFINFSLFQRLHQLNITGKLDNQTLTKMKSPRCGIFLAFN